MAAAYVTEIRSYTSFTSQTSSQLSNLQLFSSLNNRSNSNMAPNEVSRQKLENEMNLVPVDPKSFSSPETSMDTDGPEHDSEPSTDIQNNGPKEENVCSDDSSSMNSDSSNYQVNQDVQSPLEQLQSSLQNNGPLGQNIYDPNQPNGAHNSVDATTPERERPAFNGLYSCHSCDFVGQSDDELHEHLRIHYPYECSLCGYLTNSKNLCKIHMKKHHSSIPKREWNRNISAPKKDDKSNKQKSSPDTTQTGENFERPRKTSCKLCKEFVGESKLEYYRHLEAQHRGSGRLLACDICPFISLYKHHLEYHVRNHYGSKPFQCDKCTYSCVNRSMLNSHYKSHSNVYQYSCNNCSYITKYLHSLKLHLRKYDHAPGQTLNTDGSINRNSIIDIHGRRRGPKGKKRNQKSESRSIKENRETPMSTNTPSPSNSHSSHPSVSTPILYRPSFFNSFAGSMYVRSPALETSNCPIYAQPNMTSNGCVTTCKQCEYVPESVEAYQNHMNAHTAQQMFQNNNFTPNFVFPLQACNLDLVNNYAARYSYNPYINGATASGYESRNNTAAGDYDSYAHKFVSTTNGSEERKQSVSPISNGEQLINKSPEYYKQFYRKFLQTNKTEVKLSNPLLEATATRPQALENKTSVLENGYSNGECSGHAPLDLSRKSPVTSELNYNKGSVNKPEMEENVRKDVHPSPSASPNFNIRRQDPPPQQRVRNRRKKTPCKIDQYTIYDDQNLDVMKSEQEIMNIYVESIQSAARKRCNNSTISWPVAQNSVSNITNKSMLQASKLEDNGISRPMKSTAIPEQQPSPVSSSRKTMSWNYLPIKSAKDTVPKTQGGDSSNSTPAVPKIENGGSDLTSNTGKCHFCQVDFGDATLNESHSSYHTPGDPFTCAKCKFQLKDKVTVILDLDTNVEENTGTKELRNFSKTVPCDLSENLLVEATI